MFNYVYYDRSKQSIVPWVYVLCPGPAGVARRWGYHGACEMVLRSERSELRRGNSREARRAVEIADLVR